MTPNNFNESSQQQLNNVGECLYRSTTSGIYYALFKRGGRQIKQSLRTTDKELAKRRAELLRQKVIRLNTKESRTLLFLDLANRWLASRAGSMKASSFQRRRESLATFRHFFGSTVKSIRREQIEEWAARRASTRSARTFNIDRETLLQVFEYAVSHGLLLENPARFVRRKKQGKHPLLVPSKSQFRTLVEQLRSEPKAKVATDLIEFLAYSGCRLREATGMRWNEINFAATTFIVTGGEAGTKNHEVRTVPLFGPLERLLMKMREDVPATAQPTEKLFYIEHSRQALGSACRNANLPHFTHHSLRHFFCSNAIEAGIDFKVIAGWLGHKDGGVLVAKTYGHLRDEHSTLMAKRMTFDVNEAPAMDSS